MHSGMESDLVVIGSLKDHSGQRMLTTISANSIRQRFNFYSGCSRTELNSFLNDGDYSNVPYLSCIGVRNVPILSNQFLGEILVQQFSKPFLWSSYQLRVLRELFQTTRHTVRVEGFGSNRREGMAQLCMTETGL